MVHREFDIEPAIQRYPLDAARYEVRQWAIANGWPQEPVAEFEYYVLLNGPRGESITTEKDAALVEQLRREVARIRPLGRAVPTDVLIWQQGDCDDLRVSRIGGAPTCHVEDWPMDPEKRTPMCFIGQICFADSHDVIGQTPGEVLLIFNTPHVTRRRRHAKQPGNAYAGEHWAFRWAKSRESEQTRRSKPGPVVFPDVICHAVRWRTVDYPDSWDAFEKHEPLRDPRSPDKSMACTWQLATLEATRVGGEPRGIQETPAVGSRFLAEFHSVGFAEPDPEYQYSPACLPTRGVLDIGDAGSVYLGIDDNGNIHWDWQCY